MDSKIKVYPRDGKTGMDGINEGAFAYELRFKEYTTDVQPDLDNPGKFIATIDWMTQSGEMEMLCTFYREIERCLEFIQFKGKCHVKVCDRDGYWSDEKTIKIN